MYNYYITFNSFIEQGQSFLESYITAIPKDALKSVVYSFTYSFAVSTLLSGGNPMVGLAGGTLTALATTVHTIFMTALNNLNHHLCHRFNKPYTPIPFEMRHCAFLMSWGSILYLGNMLELTNNKASLLATLPFVIWKNTFGNPTETPLMGIIAI